DRVPRSLPPGRDTRTARSIEGFFWWTVPAQVPLTCWGMGRSTVAGELPALAFGVGAGVPEPGCRPAVNSTAATIPSTQPPHPATPATVLEWPPRGGSPPGTGAGTRPPPPPPPPP